MTPHAIGAETLNSRRAAVVGAGLGGLSAAYRLQLAGWDVTVFEAGPQVGGRTQTFAKDGYLADMGATAVGAGYPEYLALAEELGIEVIPGSPIVSVFRDGRVHDLYIEQPFRSGVGKLLSLPARLRLARLVADVALATRRKQLDRHEMGKAGPLDTESVRDYGLRALGWELEAYVCGPVARIMELADSEKVSKAVLFTAVSGILKGRLSSLAGGQVELARALAKRVNVELDTPVTQVAARGDGVTVTYVDRDGAESESDFDACVVACELPAAVEICPDHRWLLGPLADHVTYNQTLCVAIGTTRPANSETYVVQMPTCEEAEVAAIFLHNNKSPDRQPPGHGLIGTMWEQDAALAWMDRDDDAIVERTLRTVYRVFPELRGTVDFTHVHRWARALPLHDVGSFKRVAEFNSALTPQDRVRFTGDYRAIDGQNSAIELGAREAAVLDQNVLTPSRPRVNTAVR